MKIAIIGGASTIGTTVAYTLASTDPSAEVYLVDKAEKVAWAHAKDIYHALYHAANAPVLSHIDSFGTIEGTGTDELERISPDVVIITAAATKPEDKEVDESAREIQLQANIPIMEDIASQLATIDPVPVIMVTNPIDRLTYYLWQLVGWSRHYFIGYSLSETARAADALAQNVDAHPCEVYCPIMGEHGRGIVPILSKATVDGDAIEVNPSLREEVIAYTRQIPFDIAAHRGVAETSRWVTSAGVTRLVRELYSSDSSNPFCLSTPLLGEYGIDRGCLSVPVTLSPEGVRDILEWDLLPEEIDAVQQAHEKIWEDLQTV